MRKYELVIILPSGIGEQKKSLVEKLKKMIEGEDGKIFEEKDWGTKELSYPIKREKDGLYLFFELELPPTLPTLLEQNLRLEEKILRHLLVRKENA